MRTFQPTEVKLWYFLIKQENLYLGMPNFTFAFNYRKVLIIQQQLSCLQVKEKNVFDVEEMKLMEFSSETSIFVSM